MNSPTSSSALSAPPTSSTPGSTEILRVWVTPDRSSTQFSLAPKFEDPAAWGILLADLARHVARAYAQAHATPEEQTLRRIWQAVDSERGAPTDKPRQLPIV